MADKVNRNVATWVRRQLTTNRKEGRCVRIALYHVTTSSKYGAQIATVDVKEAMGDVDTFEAATVDGFASTFADSLVSEATNYAEGMNESQKFALGAFFEDREDEALARTAFRIVVEGADDDDMDSEPASLQGLVRQQMRHNEAILKIALASMGGNLNTLQKINDRQSTALEKLMHEKAEALDTMESLLSAKHQRDLETMAEQAKIETRAKLVNNIVPLLPAVANKIIGKKILPETEDPTLRMVVALAENLTPDEFKAMMGALPVEKQAVLVELMSSVQARVGAAPDAEDKGKDTGKGNGN